MKTRHALIVVALLLAACARPAPPDQGASAAANTTDTSDFTVTAAPGRWRNQPVVQGYVYNKRGLRATRMLLRVDTLDSTNTVTSSEVRHLDRDIPPNDRVFYQVPASSSPAPAYRVSVDYVFWYVGDGGGGAM